MASHGGATRTALRATVRAALDALPRMAGVPHRGLLSPRPDLSQIPERMVATPAQRSDVAAMGGDTDDEFQLMVMVRRKGEDAQDQLDLDQDQIEPAVIAALDTYPRTCALVEARFDFDAEGVSPLAQITLTFAVRTY
jgi:hypothetical protein